MRQLEQVKQLTVNSKAAIWQKAQSAGRDVKLYLHWSAGHYGQFFDDYHINIDYDGSIYVSTDDFAEIKAHTWRRNTGAIGIALACCYKANTNDFGPEPPTEQQIEAMARIVAVLCKTLDLTIDVERVMTHAEAADLDDYGPATTCERWDLWFLPGTAKGDGGKLLRGKAVEYQQKSGDSSLTSI